MPASASLNVGVATLVLFKYADAVPLHVRVLNTPPLIPRVVVSFSHNEKPGVAVIIGFNSSRIVTVIFARSLSQPFTVCETQCSCFPTSFVEGVGAIELLLPPSAAVYHVKLLPPAVKAGISVAPLQYCKSATVGVAGIECTVTEVVAGDAIVQP